MCCNQIASRQLHFIGMAQWKDVNKSFCNIINHIVRVYMIHTDTDQQLYTIHFIIVPDYVSEYICITKTLYISTYIYTIWVQHTSAVTKYSVPCLASAPPRIHCYQIFIQNYRDIDYLNILIKLIDVISDVGREQPHKANFKISITMKCMKLLLRVTFRCQRIKRKR